MEADSQDEITAAATLPEAQVIELFSEELGSIPTRVIVVEELRNCGVISKKKAKKRITEIMSAFDEVETH